LEEPQEVQIVNIDGYDCIDGEVIIKFKDSVSNPQAEDALKNNKSKVKRRGFGRGLTLAEVPARESVKGFIKKIENMPEVEFVQPNYVYTLDMSVNDPHAATDQWYLNTIGAYRAWDFTMGSASVRVGIIDTGIDLGHPEFSGRIHAQYNAADNNSDVSDNNGHGTHVAGIIAANANNATGIAGIAPGVKLIVVDVFGEASYASTVSIARGIDYAASQGANVINISLGCYLDDAILRMAIDNAARNVVVVASGGNNSTNNMHYPSDYDNSIAVTATTSADTIAAYSNFGAQKDISAPGSGIFSTYLNNGYRTMSGTSMAAPVVSAVAALVLSANPSLSVSQVKDILYNTAVDLGAPGKDDYYGHGRVNAYAAVAVASGGTPVPKEEPVNEEQPPLLVSSVAVTSSSDTVRVSDAIQMGTIINPSGADNKAVTWSVVGGTGSATIDSSGVLRAISEGTVMVQATAVDGTGAAGQKLITVAALSINAIPVGYNSTRISWNAVSGARGYEVLRASSPNGPYRVVKRLSRSRRNYSDRRLLTGTTYYYKVRPFRTAGRQRIYGEFSDIKGVTPTLAGCVLSAASVRRGTVRLAWRRVKGASGYEVFRSLSPDGEYTLVSSVRGRSYLDKSAVAGATYYYRVRPYRNVNRQRVYGGFSGVRSVSR